MRLRLAALLLVVAGLVAPTGYAGAQADTAQPTAVEGAQPDWGDETSPIRPGASLGGYCTYNWVFYRPAEPTLEDPDPAPTAYIGTAGHCTDELGERVQLGDGGPEIGTVVYDSDEVGSSVDFSLIELDAERVSETNPTMLGWGGPTGSIEASELAIGDRVDVHGYGMVLGENDVTRSRFGFLVNWTDDEYVADMPAVWGDSGSPLLHHDTGKALGIISQFGFFATPPSTDTGPMMPWIFRELEAAGLGAVLLATATS